MAVKAPLLHLALGMPNNFGKAHVKIAYVQLSRENVAYLMLHRSFTPCNRGVRSRDTDSRALSRGSGRLSKACQHVL